MYDRQPQQTVSEVRHSLTKPAEPWCCKFGFVDVPCKSIIIVGKSAMPEDALMELVLEAGAEDMSAEGDEYEITTPLEGFENVRTALEKQA